jgi:membrane protein YdbS with pleckstrin-like domain
MTGGDGPVDRRSLAPRVRVIWGLRVAATLVVLTALATVAVLATDVAPPWITPVVGAVAVLLALGWVEWRYRVWAFEVRADALYLERGVVTHVRTIAPHVRIQHVDTSRGPLERWLGLSTLVVYTAGSRGADVAIPGLTAAEATELQSRVKQLAIEAEGGDAV